MPQPQPLADADKDGVPDASDLCPLLVGSAPTTRPGPVVPFPAQLGTACADGEGWHPDGKRLRLRRLDIASVPRLPHHPPIEAATARQVVVDYSLSAKAAWAPSSDWCTSQGLPNRHHIGQRRRARTTYCLAYGYVPGSRRCHCPQASSSSSQPPTPLAMRQRRSRRRGRRVRSVSSTPRRRMWYD
jgi:hypothetical protein